MHARTRSILEAAVRDFIESGKPITSEYLYDIHDFGIKPAMIRWELNDLAERGFFYQEHPSGGRFPTDKAYQFFVDTLLSGEEENTPALQAVRAPADAKEFVHEIADYLELLSVGYDLRERVLYGSGLAALLSRLGEHAFETARDAVNEFESLEDRLAKRKSWWEDETLWPKVFVGQSPVTKSDRLSVIAAKLECGGNEMLVLTIGPKRMDYQKAVNFFQSFTKTKKKKKCHE